MFQTLLKVKQGLYRYDKIFIDTNIFLGLYESNEDTIEIFKDIEKVKINRSFHVKYTMSFFGPIRTRRLKSNIKTNYKIEIHPTSLVDLLQNIINLKRSKRIARNKKSLIQKIEK